MVVDMKTLKILLIIGSLFCISEIMAQTYYYNTSTTFKQTGPHKAYNILAEPQYHWKNTYTHVHNVWTDVLDYVCDWALHAKNETELITDITTKAYTGLGKEYTEEPNFTFEPMCNLTGILQGTKVDCWDMAAVVYMFSCAAGSSNIRMRRVYGPFDTHPVLPTGLGAIWETHRWRYHVFAWYNDTVYDACIKVNQANPYLPVGDDYNNYKYKVWNDFNILRPFRKNEWHSFGGASFFNFK